MNTIDYIILTCYLYIVGSEMSFTEVNVSSPPVGSAQRFVLGV